jgi:hypothetical protein
MLDQWKLACQLHIYYSDLWPEKMFMIRYLFLHVVTDFVV